MEVKKELSMSIRVKLPKPKWKEGLQWHVKTAFHCNWGWNLIHNPDFLFLKGVLHIIFDKGQLSIQGINIGDFSVIYLINKLFEQDF